MLKKLISLSVFALVILPLMLIPACEDWLTYEVTICDVELLANPEEGFWDNQDTVISMTEDIAFWVLSDPGQATCWAPSIPFVNTAYATSPCARYTNSLSQSTFDLCFDREITFENEIIAANTNLFRHPEIAAEILVEINADCDWYNCLLTFSPALRNAITFDTGEYLVSFSCETSDDRQVEDSVRVIFRL